MVRVSGWSARLVAATTAVTAPGSDPEAIAALVSWAVRPRRPLEALRRTARDAGVEPDGAAGALAAASLPHVDEHDAHGALAAVDAWSRLGCRLAIVGDAGYPPRLAAGWPDLDAPTLLAVRGGPDRGGPVVALVGARRATPYGTGVTSWLASAAVTAGATVVSGGAIGIDAAAHRATLDASGRTCVVLGCGHAVAYPRPHARAGALFDQIRARGGQLLSEQFPQVPPRAAVVRARNRIVAGLADVVVVIEGGGRSGALVTAGAAAAWGRPVLAVPGDVRAPGSAAPHRLLREGAAPCAEPADLLDALGITTPATAVGALPAPAVTASASSAGGLGRIVLGELRRCWPRPVPIDDLVDLDGGDVGRVLAALTAAEVAGTVIRGPDGVRLTRAPVD